MILKLASRLRSAMGQEGIDGRKKAVVNLRCLSLATGIDGVFCSLILLYFKPGLFRTLFLFILPFVFILFKVICFLFLLNVLLQPTECPSLCTVSWFTVSGVLLEHTISRMQCSYGIAACTEGVEVTRCHCFNPSGNGDKLWTALRTTGCLDDDNGVLLLVSCFFFSFFVSLF